MINISQYLNQCGSVKEIFGTPPKESLGFCHDSRHYIHPSFFVAYKGAKYNPLEHINDMLVSGCPLVIFESTAKNDSLVNEYRNRFPKVSFVRVEDCITFTQELASVHTKNWQKSGGYLFAISGSNGKTTHKEMLSFILSEVFEGEIESTQKNNNNHLGVPFTLLQIKPKTKVCILELGSNHPGEIKVLCEIAAPQGGLVTNIGATHLEFFDNLENVFIEEGYLHKYLLEMKPEKVLFFKNLDDDFLKTSEDFSGVRTFSKKDAKADFYFEIDAPTVSIHSLGVEIKITNNNIVGSHNFSNLATAYSVAQCLFPSKKDELAEACNRFKPTFNRSQWQKIKNVDVFLDAYNANPSSMKIALDGFFEEIGRRNIQQAQTTLFLGDMNELGSNSDSYHQELGEYLKKWPLARVVFIGRYASHYLKGKGGGQSFKSVSEIDGAKWKDLTNNATHVFIKGSRSLQLESLLAIT